MTIHKASNLTETVPSGTQSPDVIAISGKAPIASGVTLTEADEIELVYLPAGHVPVDFILDVGDLDGGGSPALVVHVGFVNNTTGADDDADAFVASSTVGQAGGIARATAAGFTGIKAVPRDRLIGVTVATTANGATAAARSVVGTLLCRRQHTSRDR